MLGLLVNKIGYVKELHMHTVKGYTQSWKYTTMFDTS